MLIDIDTYKRQLAFIKHDALAKTSRSVLRVLISTRSQIAYLPLYSKKRVVPPFPFLAGICLAILGGKLARYSGVACNDDIIFLELASNYFTTLVVVCEHFQETVRAVFGHLRFPCAQDGDGCH